MYFFSIGIIILHFGNNHDPNDIVSLINQCEKLDYKRKDAIDRRIRRINSMYGQKGYEGKSIRIKNPDDWKVVFEEHKKQLRKGKS